MPSKFAFPTANGSPGLTVRDYFAVQALNGIIAGNKSPIQYDSYEIFAKTAYKMADAMLQARGPTSEE